MKEDETHIIKPHDFAEIVKAPELGFLACGPKEWTLSVGRLVQAPFRAKLFQQVTEEIEGFRAKGRIRNDFADQDKGAKSWVDLLQSSMRNRRMRKGLTLKAMFFSVNKINIDDAESIKQYQIFQLAKKLSSNDLIVLKAVVQGEKSSDTPTQHNYDQWVGKIAQSIGHSLSALVDIADRNLEEHGFFKRLSRGSGGVVIPRMTDLGYQLCHDIEWYHIEKNRIASGFYTTDANR